MNKNYKPPKISSGDLRVPVTFFRMVENDGPFPGSKRKKKRLRRFVKFTKVLQKI